MIKNIIKIGSLKEPSANQYLLDWDTQKNIVHVVVRHEPTKIFFVTLLLFIPLTI